MDNFTQRTTTKWKIHSKRMSTFSRRTYKHTVYLVNAYTSCRWTWFYSMVNVCYECYCTWRFLFCSLTLCVLTVREDFERQQQSGKRPVSTQSEWAFFFWAKAKKQKQKKRSDWSLQLKYYAVDKLNAKTWKKDESEQHNFKQSLIEMVADADDAFQVVSNIYLN